MVCLYFTAWILCITGVVLHKRYSFCIGPHVLKDTYDRKTVALAEAVVLVLVFLLLTANRTGQDIIRYVQAYQYNHAAFETKDKLFGVLSMVAYDAGLDFYVFRAVLTFLAGVMAVATIKKVGTDFSFLLLFYLPSMIFVDSMQFRNAVCLSLFLWSFRYLLFEEKHAKMKYLICVFIIAQIHALYYFTFVLAVFFVKSRRKQIAGFIALSGILIAAVTILNGNQIPFFTVVTDLFLSKTDLRGDRYYTAGNMGWVVPAAIHVMTTLLGFVVHRYGNRGNSDMAKYQKEYLDLMLVYDFVLFVTVPAIMMNMHYYRLVRGAFMVNVIGASFLFRQKKRQDKFPCMVFLGLAALAAMWYVLDIVIFEDRITMAVPVLNGKLFFLK